MSEVENKERHQNDVNRPYHTGALFDLNRLFGKTFL